MISQGNRPDSWWTKISPSLRSWGVGFLLTLVAILWLSLVASNWSKASEGEKSDDEYNFNWLDTDKKIYVLQNRKYLKTGHAILSVTGGVGFSNPYKNAYNVDPRLAFYMSEAFGIEVFYTWINNSSNNNLKALQSASPSVFPQIREIRAQYGGMLHYTPWYAKINVFNAILYFDWYFGLGAGNVSTFVDTRTTTSVAPNVVQQDVLGIFFSTGQFFHLSQRLLFRIDFTGAYYQVPINGTSGETSWYSNLNLGIGLGLKI